MLKTDIKMILVSKILDDTAVAIVMERNMTRRTILFLVSVLLLGGCGDNKPSYVTDEAPVAAGASGLSSSNSEEQDNTLISGLWDISLKFEDGTVDERSLDIPEQGQYLTFFDYEGDQNGSGENCHTKNVFSMTHVRDSGYLVDGARAVAFKRTSSDVLTQVNIDTTDEDGDGDTADAFVQNWRIISGLSSSDYNICEVTSP